MKAGTNRLLLAYPRRPKYSYPLDRGSLVHLYRALSCIYRSPRLWRLPPDALTVAAAPRSICHVSLPPRSLWLVPLQSAGHFVRFSSPPLSLRVVPPQVHALLLSTPGSISSQVLILLCALILLHTHRSDLSLLLIGSPDWALWRPPASTLLPLVHGCQGEAIGFVRNYLQLHLCVAFPDFGFPMTFPSFIVLLSTLAKGQSIHNVR
jgi:hypothetical protein